MMNATICNSDQQRALRTAHREAHREVPTERRLAVADTVEALNPVLTDIRCSLAHSEETPMFTAILVLNGQRFSVRNEGRGGGNYYHPHMSEALMDGLNRLSATNLPAIPGSDGFPSLPMDFETWTFGAAYDQAEHGIRQTSILPPPGAPANYISFKAFENLPRVVELLAVLRSTKKGTKKHRAAFDAFKAIAQSYATEKGNSLDLIYCGKY